MNVRFHVLCLVLILNLGTLWCTSDFVEVHPDVGRQVRTLLESTEEPTPAPEPSTTEAPKKKGLFQPGEYLLGPKLFFDGSHFAMKIGSPIKVTIFDGEDHKKKLSKISLDAPALSVKGSMIATDKTDFKVNLDWKQQDFGSDLKVSSIHINMYFKRKNEEYYMYQLEVVKLVVGMKHLMNIQFEVETKDGYKVAAPIGSSFACSDLDMFLPPKNETGPYWIGISLPDVQLQVFQIKNTFGPAWDCDYLMSAGLLVGLVLTLFFALICYWGFSMLASINTMDRFDDPKGKQIYIPQTD